MTNEERFNKLRAKYLAAVKKADDYSAQLAAKYGYGYQRHWLKTSEERKLTELRRKSDKPEDEFFALLDTISLRNWRSGVAVSWVMEELTYADATTTGELSTMPMIARGCTEWEMKRFMAPITK